MTRKSTGINSRGYRVGEGHQRAVLSDHEIDLVRHLHEEDGLGYRKLAVIFEMSKSAIREICLYRVRAQTPDGYKTIKKDEKKIQPPPIPRVTKEPVIHKDPPVVLGRSGLPVKTVKTMLNEMEHRMRADNNHRAPDVNDNPPLRISEVALECGIPENTIRGLMSHHGPIPGATIVGSRRVMMFRLKEFKAWWKTLPEESREAAMKKRKEIE